MRWSHVAWISKLKHRPALRPTQPGTGILVAVVVGLIVGGHSLIDPSVATEGSYRYETTGPLALAGEINGICTWTGIEARNIAPHAILGTIEHDGAVVERVRTWTNTTTLDGAATIEPEHADGQEVRRWQLPPGELEIQGGEGVTLAGYASPETDARATFQSVEARLDAPREATAGIPSYPAQSSDDVTALDPTWQDGLHDRPHRALKVDDTVTIAGDFDLLLLDVSIRTHDQHIESGAHVHEENIQVGAADRTMHRYTHIRIQLDEARWIATGATISPLCTALGVEVDGDITIYAAQGNRGPGPAQTMRGALLVHETIQADGRDAPRAIGTIDGDTELQAEGFTITDVTARPVAAAAGLGLLGLLAVAAKPLTYAAIGLYTRIAEHQLLDHPRRRLLHDYITANPGATLADAARDLDIARAVLEHHVVMLEHAAVVRRVHIDGVRRMLAGDDCRQTMAAALVERHEPLKWLAVACHDGPVLRAEAVRGLMSSLDLSERSARRWIAKAIEHEIVAKQGQGKGVSLWRR